MIFTNNVGETISGVTVTDAKWAQEDLAGGAGCAVTYPDVGGVPGTSAKAGDPITVVCSFTNSGDTAFPPVGSKMKFNIDISYLPQGKTYTKPLTAEVFTTLKPSP